MATSADQPKDQRKSNLNIVHQGSAESSDGSLEKSERSFSGWQNRRCHLIIVLIFIVLLIITIVSAVEVSRANRHPNYFKLTYHLNQTYAGASFFDNFNYFNGYDPAQGFVHYAAKEAALALNLTYASTTSAILRVDTSNADTTTGRISARVESKTTYNSGLFIFDIIHSPHGCSTWPALWLADPSHWPEHGEIDILESSNTASTGNQITLHTTSQCKMDVKRKHVGKVLYTNCHNTTNKNAGCGVKGPTQTIGQSFNALGGGVYALEWRKEGIRTWFFDRSSIPVDISTLFPTTTTTTTITSPSQNLTPSPNAWPKPLADFPSTACDIPSHFKNMSIIANIDLCGQLAGLPERFTGESGCPGRSCVEYVSTMPGEVYQEAYWEFGGWWVFQAE